MSKYQPYLKSIFFLYLLWMSILIINLVWSIFTSDYKAKIGEEAFDRFILLTIGFSLVVIVFGALLAWLAQREKKWASWLFIIFCGWRAFDSICSNIRLNELNPELLETSDWIRGLIFSLVWICFMSLTWHLRIRNKGTPIL